MTGLQLVCAACGWTPGPLEIDPYPFRCPRAGSDDGDHVVRCSATPAPDGGAAAGVLPTAERTPPLPAENPFIRYRTSLYSWHVAQARADTARLCCTSAQYRLDADRDYCSVVEQIDAAIERVAGTGFRITPFFQSDGLRDTLGFQASGGIWVKDETRNVSGSHKARHMMGVALYLEVLRGLGIDRGGDRPLAVASCGNAALAAAVVARAIGRSLLVFVPEHASTAIVAQLEQLGATVTRCRRTSGLGASTRSPRAPQHGDGARDPAQPEPAEGGTPEFERVGTGDPCYAAFRRAVADGALPFSCQGNENGLMIEGGATVGHEILDQMRPALDRIFVQVGGGALASACGHAFSESLRAGRLAAMPRIHTVQTCGAFPLKRAYDRFVEHVLERLPRVSAASSCAFSSDDERATYLSRAASGSLLGESLRYARTHRSQFMWPWETEPRSIANGILDDETYDWAAVVESMVRTGGFPIVVDEETLQEANRLARENTGIDVDHTGSSGLAGLIALTRSAARPRPTERVAVIFTGVRRS